LEAITTEFETLSKIEDQKYQHVTVHAQPRIYRINFHLKNFNEKDISKTYG